MSKYTIALLIMASSLCHAEILTDVWITKDALKSGIKHEKVELVAGGRVALSKNRYYSSSQFELTEQDAIAKAEVMRRREVAKLQKRLAELNSMTFEGSK